MRADIEVDTLARTIYGEARGEEYEGQVAVAWVIKNRVGKRNWGQTFADVCRKPLQFSCWNTFDPNYPRLLAADFDDARFTRAFGIACLVIVGELPDPTLGANHYHTVQKPNGLVNWPPVWSRAMVETVVIGAHRFLRDS